MIKLNYPRINKDFADKNYACTYQTGVGKEVLLNSHNRSKFLIKCIAIVRTD